MSSAPVLVERVTGTAAAGLAVAPVEVFSTVLISNGLWLFSYADWMKLAAFAYVLVMLFKTLKIVQLFRWVYRKISGIPRD